MTEPTQDFASFGVMLRHLRRRSRLTQRELGIAVGYSEAHIARLEANQRRPDVAAVTSRFIDALDLTAEAELSEKFIALASSARRPSTSGDATSDILSDAPPTNLREQLTAFIGRVDELSEVKRLLSGARLLTITGMGGIGKSRLAAQVATELLPNYTDGAWIASFARMTEPSQVLTTVAATMNLASSDLHEGLKTYLHSRKALLVMDNCEHLVGACAQLAVSLLQACPNLNILATSREAFNVPGEIAWSLPPMTCEEGQRLFVERARAMRTDFEATPDMDPLLDRLCDELEGIPLAIELAAARLQVLSLSEIVDMLDDRFRLLVGGNRLAHARQQSMRALIDWSYNLLTPPERALFRALSAFEQEWTLDDVAKVSSNNRGIGGADVLDLLTQLVKKSLVLIDEGATPARYHMLKTVRQYAQERALEVGHER